MYRSIRTSSTQSYARIAQAPTKYVLDVTAVAPSDVRLGTCEGLAEVVERFPFRSNDYYTSLINWNDPADPIRALIYPQTGELVEFGTLDASNEAANTPVRGLQHKYRDTALLLVTDQCGGFCRYCFRKRLFLPGERETVRGCSDGVAYIREHNQITDVLLTGGDPLTLPTPVLEGILDQVLSIPHVRTVRIGSKMPAFNPYRIIDDSRLQSALATVVRSGRSLYVSTHFDHAREITLEAKEAIHLLRATGAMCVNQCPMCRGINDSVAALSELFQACTDIGCPQYYVFQCRPTLGNAPFVIPLSEAFGIFDEARTRVSGLSRRARFCMSHERGKIEIVGADSAHVYARFHRAKYDSDVPSMLVIPHREDMYWFEDSDLGSSCGES